MKVWELRFDLFSPVYEKRITFFLTEKDARKMASELEEKLSIKSSVGMLEGEILDIIQYAYDEGKLQSNHDHP